ncbi:TPA: hypothetical protein ACMDOZ_002223 [Vibrio cholerae]
MKDKIYSIIKNSFFPVRRVPKSLASYIDLEIPCPIDSNAVVTTSGKRLTILNIKGQVGLLSQDSYKKVNKQLLSLIKRLYKNERVYLAWSFEQDIDNVLAELHRGTSAGRISASKIGVEDNLFFDDVIESNKEHCSVHSSWLAVWTEPKIDYIVENGVPIAVKQDNFSLKKFHEQLFSGSANPFLTDAKAVAEHQQNVNMVKDAFHDMECVVIPLSGKAACSFLGQKLNRGFKGSYNLEFADVARLFETTSDPDTIDYTAMQPDVSKCFVGKISDQIAGRGRSIFEDEAIDGMLVDDNYHYSVRVLQLAPKAIIPFNNFKKNLKKVPFRMTFLMKPKKLSFTERLNESLITFGRAAEDNQEAYRQLRYIKAMKQEHGHPEIHLQIMLVTWAKTKDELNRFVELIDSALEDWGGAQAIYDVVSPWQTLISSIGGMSTTCHAHGFIADPDRLVGILPHQRSANMIDSGPIIFRDSETGEPLFFGPQLKCQSYDLTLYLARPRMGKSLLMNSKGVGNLFTETCEGINLLGSLDIGPNMAGAFQLLKMMLSKQLGYDQASRLVIAHKWDPTNGNWSVNPLDIGFGQSKPTLIEKSGMLNFYVSVCADPESGKVSDGTTDILSEVIDEVFERSIDVIQGIKYDPHIYPEIHKLLTDKKVRFVNNKIEGKEAIGEDYRLWIEIRDILFQLGYVEFAQRAHVRCIPTIDRIIDELSSNHRLNEKYAKTHPNVIDKIRFSLVKHASSSKHLTRHTTLDLHEARFISFDLKPLSSAKNSKSGVIRLFSEYLLAMTIIMRNFSISESILNFEHLNSIYLDYWRDKINKFANLNKCLNLDEWHLLSVKKSLPDGRVISEPVAGAEYLDGLIKEAPKWKLSINIATHSPNDLTQVMRQKATNIFFYSGFDGEEADEIKNLFNLSEDEVLALKALHGPQANIGTEMLYIHHINSPHIKGSGRCIKRIEYQCSGSLLWALNTSADDLPHKLRLESEFRDQPWLTALIDTFPNGSMDRERKELSEIMNERGFHDEDGATIETKLYQSVVARLQQLKYSSLTLRLANET